LIDQVHELSLGWSTPNGAKGARGATFRRSDHLYVGHFARAEVQARFVSDGGPLRDRFGLEPVTNAAHRRDPAGMIRIDLDLGANPTNMLGDRRFVLPLARRGPDVLEELARE